MIYYADYEALEFNNVAATKEKIYPYYLNSSLSSTSLCPIYFSAANKKGELIESQNVYNSPISFITFLNRIISHMGRTEFKTFQVWFHNIQYDFRIIVHELFHNGFKHVFDSENITYTGNYNNVMDNSFSIVGSNLTSYKGVNIYFRGFKILLRDTMGILNSAQDKILKEFNFDSKTKVNWDSITIDNLKSNMSLIKERCEYDVKSLALAIEQFKQTFYDHFNGRGSTAASMSFDALRYYFCTLENIDFKLGTKQPSREEKDNIFRQYYPKLELDKLEISAGTYHGGICTINKKYAGKILHNIQMLDINSSYSYSMTLPLPYGEGKTIQDFSITGYSEYVIYIEFKMKGIPFQRCHSENRARKILGVELNEKSYTRSQFPENFKGYLCINSIDLETLQKYANVTVCEFLKGVNYNVDLRLKDFITTVYEERRKSQGVKKLAIKLLLNSLYGKFAQDLSGIVYQYDSLHEYRKIKAIDNETFYKPFASAVTAYSRRNWVNTVYTLGVDFIYGDTDSVYFTSPDRNMCNLTRKGSVDNEKLGYWSREYRKIFKGKFLSKKNYIIDCEEWNKDKKEWERKIKLTCVGLSKKYHNQINFDNFEIDSSEFRVQKMVNIYGGKAMRDTVFKIRERTF